MTHTLAVIPARMGSTRIPNKNLKVLPDGQRLVDHAVWCAHGTADRIVVSTDAPDMVSSIGHGAHILRRPDDISGASADIADATRHALLWAEEQDGVQYDTVLTLQPAVIARSPGIVADMVSAFHQYRAGGAICVAKTHPWIWRVSENARSPYSDDITADWDTAHYPRSQDLPLHLVEVNACQIASRETVLAGRRWSFPLLLYRLPSYAPALDIDDQQDMDTACAMWPSASRDLLDWRGRVNVHEGVH